MVEVAQSPKVEVSGRSIARSFRIVTHFSLTSSKEFRRVKWL
jgi:hypothetical protein